MVTEKEGSRTKLDPSKGVGNGTPFLHEPIVAMQTFFSVVPNDELSGLVTTPFNYKVTQSTSYIKALNAEGQELFKHCKNQVLELTTCKESFGTLHHEATNHALSEGVKAMTEVKWLKVNHEKALKAQLDLNNALKAKDDEIKKLTWEPANSFIDGFKIFRVKSRNYCLRWSPFGF
ncbi:unnamed protein product [Ilex paraguariensis]|uniref:Uncharacterized protein n=1 Tax=Ilex paraguariensis TaxID=185542 RepID=A0ABC8RDB8_9AQUA